MEETNKPKTKTKPKKSHSEYLIIDMYVRNGVIYMVKAHPQKSPEFIPTNSNFTPKSFCLIKLFIRFSYALFF